MAEAAPNYPRITVSVPDSDQASKLPITSSGVWRPDELRLVSSADGQAAFIGDCFATEEAAQHVLARAIETQHPERLLDLPGNYSAIMSDVRGGIAGVSTLSGDHCLYYGRTEQGRPVVSTQPVFCQARTIDHVYVAARLAIPGAESIFPDRSSFLNVSKLAGGQMLRATSTGSSLMTYDGLRPKGQLTFEEAAYWLGDALTRAVAARVDRGERLSADFSGGKDSTPIAFLALRQIIARQATGELPVFFIHSPPPETDDWLYAKQFAALDPRLKLHHFNLIHEELSYTFEEALALPVAEDLAHAAKTPREKKGLRAHYGFVEDQCGPGMHLSGDGGDEVVGMSSLYLADSLRSLDLKRFLQDGMSYARLGYTSPFPLWKNILALSRHGPPGLLHRAANSLVLLPEGIESTWNATTALHQPGGPIVGWLTNQTRRDLAEQLYDRAAALSRDASLGDYVATALLRCAGQGIQTQRQHLRAVGSALSMQYPFLDKEVIQAAFSVAATEKGSPYEFKRIIRHALAGRVPDEVLQRQSKGMYNAARARSVIDSLPAIQKLLADPYLADLGIIDAVAIRESLAGVHTASTPTLWGLERIVSTELWLRHLDSKGVLTSTPAKPQQESITIAERTLGKTSYAAPIRKDAYYQLSRYVHTITSPHGVLVLFNRATDKYHPLDPTRSTILRALAIEGNLQGAVARMESLYPGADPAVIRGDVNQCCRELLDSGILLEAANTPDPVLLPEASSTIRLSATDGIVVRPKKGDVVRLGNRILAAGTLALTRLVVNKLPSQHKLSILQYIQQRWCRRDATYPEANELLRAVHSLPYLGRLACIESSYTTALAAAITRKKIEWHQGVSFLPLTQHAWVEAEGRPITTEYDGRVIGEYRSFFDRQ